MANGTSYMTFTPSGSGTSRRKGTFSAWCKRGDTSTSQRIWGTRNGSPDTTEVTFNEYIQMYASSSSSEQMNLRTTAKYRDPGAWYHVVVAYDTTQAVEANRVKLYVNGVQNSTFSTYTNYPALNDDLMLGEAYPTSVGAMGDEGSGMWNGCISHAQYVDGLQLAPTEFGEVDSTSGIWKLKTSCYATPGTNGFCLKMEDSSNLDLDSSSNGHTFTTVGTVTATKDNPSNNFCTWNPLDNYLQGATFAYGNTQFTTTTTAESWNTGTFGVSKGKWYWEVQGDMFGIAGLVTDGNTGAYYLGNKVDTWGYYVDGKLWTNGSGTAWGDTHNTTDIMGVALDLDNNFLYLAKTNVWQNSGVPTSGATGTGAITVGTPSSGFYYPANGDYGGSAVLCTGNFGNGYFGTTAVTSAEADGDGIGAFEYAPPTGYYALCTKNIKAYGG